MAVSLQDQFELGAVTLLSILAIFAEVETQEKPFLISKDGVKIIL